MLPLLLKARFMYNDMKINYSKCICKQIYKVSDVNKSYPTNSKLFKNILI